MYRKSQHTERHADDQEDKSCPPRHRETGIARSQESERKESGRQKDSHTSRKEQVPPDRAGKKKYRYVIWSCQADRQE